MGNVDLFLRKACKSTFVRTELSKSSRSHGSAATGAANNLQPFPSKRKEARCLPNQSHQPSGTDMPADGRWEIHPGVRKASLTGLGCLRNTTIQQDGGPGLHARGQACRVDMTDGPCAQGAHESVMASLMHEGWGPCIGCNTIRIDMTPKSCTSRQDSRLWRHACWTSIPAGRLFMHLR